MRRFRESEYPYYRREVIESQSIDNLLQNLEPSCSVPATSFFFIKELSDENYIVARVYNDLGNTFDGWTIIDVNAKPCPTCIYTKEEFEKVIAKVKELRYIFHAR